eukprot:superscaffoldBa00000644_g6266
MDLITAVRHGLYHSETNSTILKDLQRVFPVCVWNTLPGTHQEPDELQRAKKRKAFSDESTEQEVTLKGPGAKPDFRLPKHYFV